MNDNKNNLNERLNDNNYKILVKKLHDSDWVNIYLISADVAMLGHGCGVSQYPQFYYHHLKNYQWLPCSYLEIFDGFNGYKMTK